MKKFWLSIIVALLCGGFIGLSATERDYGESDPNKLLVLLVGQSNMAGRGYADADDLAIIPHLVMIRPDHHWQPAVEPITRDRYVVGLWSAQGKKLPLEKPFDIIVPEPGQKVRGVGLGRTFGRLLLAENPGKTVGLIPCAVGGTPIAAWMPGGIDPADHKTCPYDQAIAKAREAQKSGKIVAVLWHQGESDASRQTPEYREKLQTVISNFRRDLNLGAEVPFIAGSLADFYPEKIQDHVELVEQALAEIAASDPSFRYVSAKGLKHVGDRVHFDTASQHELGRRYFEAYRQFCQKSGISH